MTQRGQTVWITGASSGIGKALALRFANHADRIILSARHRETLEAVADEAEQPQCELIVAPLDFGNAEQAEKQAKTIVKQHGPPDILIHAAGISQKGIVVDNDLQVYRDVMEINYFGLVSMVKAALPGMLDIGAGSIVAISSLAGKIGSKNRSGYSASKFAVCGFMDCLRAEVSSQGIHCLTVCPGYVKTNIALNALNADGSKRNKSTPQIDGGMEADRCAARIQHAIKHQRNEVVIAEGLSGWAPFFKCLAPGILQRYLNGRNI